MKIIPERCCWFCSLRTGALLIAGSYMTLAIILIIVCSVIMSAINEVETSLEEFETIAVEKQFNRAYAEYAFLLTVALFSLILIILVIVGIDRDNPNLIVPFVYVSPVVIGSHFIRFIVYLCTGTIKSSEVIMDMAMQGLDIYFCLIIFAYFRQLKVCLNPVAEKPGSDIGSTL